MITKTFFCAALLAALSGATASLADPQAATTPVLWHADPSLVAKLGSEATAQSYAIRLPAGYKDITTQAMSEPGAPTRNPAFDIHMYSSGPMADGSKPLFDVCIVTPPPDVTGSLSLDDALAGTYQHQKTNWDEFVESKIQKGQIGKFTFERVYFKGMMTTPIGAVPAHGFAYATEDGAKVINMLAVDMEPHSAQTLPLMEASILTFHKQSDNDAPSK